MLIFGTNNFNLKSSPFPGHKCTRCGREETVIKISGHYAHLFFIPFFPTKKQAKIGCTSCKHINKPKEVDQGVKDFIKEAKNSVKQPWYSYSGSIFLFILILGINISSQITAKKRIKILESPEVGDVYLVKDVGFQVIYSYQKIEKVTQDSVWIINNSYIYDSRPYSMFSGDEFNPSDREAYYIPSLAKNDNILKVYRGVDDEMNFK